MAIDLGLIGYPLSHSFSPAYFKNKFLQEGLDDHHYSLFELPRLTKESFRQLILSHPNLRGLNVTIPYKQQIIPLLDELDETSSRIGAVNTISIHRDNQGGFLTKGYNTDIEGIRTSFASLLQNNPAPSHALILGTGGSSKTIAYALDERKIPYQFVSRQKKSENSLLWENLSPSLLHDFHLIVNTTPLGMYPEIEKMPPLPLQSIGKNHYIFDLIYNPDPTLLLTECAKKGAKVLSGSLMLITQAEFSYKIWQKVF